MLGKIQYRRIQVRKPLDPWHSQVAKLILRPTHLCAHVNDPRLPLALEFLLLLHECNHFRSGFKEISLARNYALIEMVSSEMQHLIISLIFYM
jgi:hypothetical protein